MLYENPCLDYLFDTTGPVSVRVKMRRWVVREGDVVERKPERLRSAWQVKKESMLTLSPRRVPS